MFLALIADAIHARKAKEPFEVAWLQKRCERRGHSVEDSKLIERMISRRHPKNDRDWVYVVDLRRCQCSCTFQVSGVMLRDHQHVDAYSNLRLQVAEEPSPLRGDGLVTG